MPTLNAEAQDAGKRLDLFLSHKIPELSRSRWQALITAGQVTVNGTSVKPRHGVGEGDTIGYVIPPPASTHLESEDIPLNILYEDEDILCLNKPPGIVVHPAPGHREGTLVNALLHHCKDLKGVGGETRPGIVHRLDKDTSGVMVVAKHDQSMQAMVRQFKSHTLQKHYLGLVWGIPEKHAGKIDTPIGRSTRDRKKMSARSRSGKPAVTHYNIVKAFTGLSLVRIRLETGRTHQIRVHMAYLGHPVAGDRTYGRNKKQEEPYAFPRQMLHAQSLAFRHPCRDEDLEIVAPLPGDIQEQIRILSTVP